MTYTDHAAQARSYQSTAAAATRKAAREAAAAAEHYATAASVRRNAAWLAGRPELWGADFNPAELEARVAAWVKLGDIYLRASWAADASAAFYRGLAGQYREMAARRAASMAAL
jgi:hypothetical protein